nr:hypothetical protein Aca09nite_67050 [Actinoplanes campanulatus]
MQRIRSARLPSPEERLAIRKRARVSREDIARELRAQGIAVTEGAVKWWEKPKAEGGVDPRPDKAILYRRLLEQLQAETAKTRTAQPSA